MIAVDILLAIVLCFCLHLLTVEQQYVVEGVEDDYYLGRRLLELAKGADLVLFDAEDRIILDLDFVFGIFYL